MTRLETRDQGGRCLPVFIDTVPDAERRLEIIRWMAIALGFGVRKSSPGDAVIVHARSPQGLQPGQVFIPIGPSPAFDLSAGRGERQERNYTFKDDVVGVAAVSLGRDEERDGPLDEWGNFPARQSALFGRLDEPVVDRAVSRLGRALTDSGYIPLPRWPHSKALAVALSHDVDAVARPGQRPRANGPWWNFERYQRIEAGRDARSTWFLSPGPGGHHINPVYDPAAPPLNQTLRRLNGDGWEIGLHAPYLDGRKVEAEDYITWRERLSEITGAKVTGVRHHWLAFDPRRHPSAQTSAALVYDTSLGYNEAVGFRAGTSLPYRLGGILEIPLSIMDGTLFWDLALEPEAALELVERLADKVAQLGGCLVILWHQRVLCEDDFPGWSSVYEKLLDSMSAKGAWLAPVGDVAQWWTKREAQCAAWSA